MSRSNFVTWNNVEYINIQELESILQDNGWIIVHPQTLTLSDQLDLFREAKIVAGFEGSAFHTLAIVDQLPTLVVIFPRRMGSVDPNFVTVARVREINQHVVRINIEQVNDTTFKIIDPYEPLKVLTNLESTI